MRLLLSAIICIVSTTCFAQHKLSGVVKNVYGEVIPNSHIDLSSLCVDTDATGNFTYTNLISGTYTLKVSANGYGWYQEQLTINESKQLTIVLSEEETLDNVVIHTTQQKTYNSQKVNQNYIENHYAGSLAKTLSSVVGLDATTVGAQNAKPMMRGLGFTRLAVTENGIKQEGQQWGADHGLELDALTTESVEVIKGVGTITHGSDAIAGVLQINNEVIPNDGFSGTIVSSFNNVNNAFANGVKLAYKKNNHFYKFKTSYTNYADFKVPVDYITYLGTKIPLVNGNMTNTAGNEMSAYGQWGYVSDDFQSILSISQFQSKSGFFAGAHGIPSVDDAKPDGNKRDINMPYQQVYHTKVTYHAKWLKPHYIWDFKLGFQRNHRQEHSSFHSHYSNQLAPVLNPTVELDFKLNTLNAELSLKKDWQQDHSTTFALQQQYQTNAIAGYSYLMPAYDRWNLSGYAKHLWNVSPRLNVELGARYDVAKLKTIGFYDTVLFDYLIESGYDSNEAFANAQRSKAVNKNFSKANFALGSTYQFSEDWEGTVTIASNFRFPTAMEFSSNGIHHGAFRHEQGNPNLNVEKGWALDLSQHYHKNQFKFNAGAYLYYFSNYIFLKPSGSFSILPHGGQIYQYAESEAMLTGLELDTQYKWSVFGLEAQLAYLYNKQLGQGSKNYPLPFSTPINGQLELQYFPKDYRFLKSQELKIGFKAALQQDRIAQNEQITPGYAIVNLGYQTKVDLKTMQPQLRFQLNNLLNTVYYHHNSFYRALDIPEFGRSFQILLSIPLN